MSSDFPLMCYVYVEASNEIGVVKWGERGYYKTDFESTANTVEGNKELVEILNSKHFELSEFEVEAMKILSMSADEKTDWESRYTDLVKTLKEHKEKKAE